MATLAALVAVGYLCGSIPVGLLLGRRTGVDVRRAGSGNVGAANVARTAGPLPGILTLVLDAAKGALPALGAHALTRQPTFSAAAGFAAFLGHVYPVTLHFAGGKGVATALGVLLALCPLSVPPALGVFIVVFAWRRYVSLASVAAAIVAPCPVGLAGCPASSIIVSVLMAAVIVFRHRGNIVRIRAGTEPQFTLHKRQASPMK